jgi:hypothetical protein
MEISVIALCVLMSVAAHADSLGKHAISIAQSAPAFDLDSAPEQSKEEEKLTSPSAATAEPQKASAEPQKIPTEPRKVSQGLLEGSVVKRRMPVYPLMPRNMSANAKVEAPIIISEAWQVIEATAVSWRPAFRSAAVDAAREWVYKSTTLNGIPTKVETVLTFTFAPGSL